MTNGNLLTSLLVFLSLQVDRRWVNSFQLSKAESQRLSRATNSTAYQPETRDAVACSPLTRPRSLTDGSGSFSSTNWPGFYPNDQLCQWLIVSQTPGSIIRLDFDDFRTEASYDYLTIFDGANANAPILTRFEGNLAFPPINVRSTGNTMFVEFRTDNRIVDHGFHVFYTTQPLTLDPDPCYPLTRPLLLTTPSGTFTSNNYPQNYWNYADCRWLIESQEPGGFVELFLNYVHTELDYDFIYIFDGSSQSDPLIARIHGNFGYNPPGPFRSTQPYMFVLFVSDDLTTYPGFSASYSSRPGPSTESTTTTTTTTTETTTETTTSATTWTTETTTSATTTTSTTTTPTPPPTTTETTTSATTWTTSEPTTTTTGPTTTRPSTTTLYPAGPCGTIMRQAPNDTVLLPGFQRMCYITVEDTDYLFTQCHELVTNIPGVGNSDDLLASGGNYGCTNSRSSGFEDAPYACFDDYQHNLELGYCLTCQKLFVCIRFN